MLFSPFLMTRLGDFLILENEVGMDDMNQRKLLFSKSWPGQFCIILSPNTSTPIMIYYQVQMQSSRIIDTTNISHKFPLCNRFNRSHRQCQQMCIG